MNSITDTKMSSWTATEAQRRASHLLEGSARHIMLAGGSRSGKTTLMVRAIVTRAAMAPFSRHAILRLNGNAARASIGLDTLPRVMREQFPKVRWESHTQDGFVRLANGSEIWVGGLDEQTATGRNRTEKILGQEYVTLYLNECSQIPYSSVLLALTRLAQVAKNETTGKDLKQRAFYDLNPVGRGHWTNVLFADKKDPISRKPLQHPENYVRMFINPIDNKEHLSAEFLESLEALPEKQRKRFYEGVYVDDMAGALWTYEVIEASRDEEMKPQERAATCKRIVVAVDPSGAASENDLGRDEIGIVVMGLDKDDHGYVLADYSLRDSPEVWGRTAVQAFTDFKADHIIAEQNFGGAMVEMVLRTADRNVPVKVITASRGKVVRAEPVSALYAGKKPRVHHCGRFPVLEDQMCSMSTMGYRGEGSPDHADAAVFGLTELMLDQMSGWGLFEHTRRMAGETEEIKLPSDMEVPADWSLPPPAALPKVEYGFSFAPRKFDRLVTVKVPKGISNIYGKSGQPYIVHDGVVRVSPEDAQPLVGKDGFERVA